MKDFLGIFIGFRKLSVLLMLIGIGIIFRLSGHLTGQNFVDLLVPISVSFMGTNIAEHVIDVAKDWLSPGEKNAGNTEQNSRSTE